MNITGLHGFARSGKDTAGRHLIEHHGAVRFAFGDTLKEQAAALDFRLDGTVSLAGLVETSGSWEAAAGHRAYGAEVRRCLSVYQGLISAEFGDDRAAADLVDDLLVLDPMIDGHTTLAGLLRELDGDWEQAKDHRLHGPEVRRFLQVYATELCRMNYGSDCWVRKVEQKVRASGAEEVVLTDVRFDSEAAWIVENGGRIIEIVRPGVGPVNGHSSEQGIDPAFISATVINDGTLDDLASRIEEAKKLSPISAMAA
ncbi:hypothetical protein [Arthrobacter caoxuetaonis]|uniref:Deoxynucleotide monophosphate kinase n=1 Tax=Arthrobacter caoxuetaonis TaxID=2886935 RepID=A0A9X1MGR0_9MICC|nr:hypothetical protein [Arthrobacter caoxuetaonis]MCC3299823.1 hypothetical protein [Arthrobacter caoxuetaonis]USQ59277.1 hypothetical protein NF551_16975 [Arthrobacter caoxuetaonis]